MIYQKPLTLSRLQAAYLPDAKAPRTRINSYMNAEQEIYRPFTKFGKTLDVKLITYTDGKVDNPPKRRWSDTIWIERGEDYYAIPRKGTVRIVERDDFLRADRQAFKK